MPFRIESMSRYDELIFDCDQDIRAGQIQKVASRLQGIKYAQIPVDLRLPLARICRRAGLYHLGLRLLSKVLDPLPLNSPPPAAVAEYSALLVRCGAISEGLARLVTIDSDVAPEALLFRTYAHFCLWQYQEGVQCLEAYLQKPLDDYARLVGRTNLAYAYAGIRNQPLALNILDENIRLTGEKKLRHLQCTCLSLRAQVRLQLKEFARARQDLTAALGLSSSEQMSNDRFIATQWQLILDGLESRSQEPFDQLRALSLSLQNWEVWRETDFYSLQAGMNRERFLRLYFGTPFPEFRELMHRELGERPSQPIYVMGKKSDPRLDLRTGFIDDKEVLAFGGKIHRMLNALLLDFYQQKRVAGLFSELFPDEQFNPSNSPGRIHQMISRTRVWLKENHIPVDIVENKGFFSLRIVGPFSFRVPLERIEFDPMGHRFLQLKKFFGDQPHFVARDAQRKLGLSKTGMHDLIQWGLQQGKLELVAQVKRASVYKFAGDPARKAS